MVRILEIKDLAKRKKELLARSEIHRQTLVLEFTNVKLGITLLKKRMRVVKTVYRLLGWTVPVGGLLFGRKHTEKKPGFLSQILSGFNLAQKIKSMFGGSKTPEHDDEETEESARI